MPFRLLTIQELEPLESDMINFLALNGISGPDWELMKLEKPELANDFIQQFSDFVWMKILTSRQFINWIENETNYYYHFMPYEVSVFKVSLNSENDDTHIGRQTATYNDDRELSMYRILEAGGVFSDGKEYKEASLLWASKKEVEN